MGMRDTVQKWKSSTYLDTGIQGTEEDRSHQDGGFCVWQPCFGHREDWEGSFGEDVSFRSIVRLCSISFAPVSHFALKLLSLTLGFEACCFWLVLSVDATQEVDPVCCSSGAISEQCFTGDQSPLTNSSDSGAKGAPP